jgi:hypothetical protein
MGREQGRKQSGAGVRGAGDVGVGQGLTARLRRDRRSARVTESISSRSFAVHARGAIPASSHWKARF